MEINELKQWIDKEKNKVIKRLKASKELIDRYTFSGNFPLDVKMSEAQKQNLLIECVATLISDEEIEVERKYAAILIIKSLTTNKEAKKILDIKEFYPIDRNDPRVREWTKEVIKKGKCELCGSEERLEAHHIIKWADYPKGRIDPKNGMCLCHSCHTEQHINDLSYSMMKAK